MTFHPLSHPQKRIWYTEALFPGTNIYNLSFSFRFKSSVNFPLLEQAINNTVKANDGLRLIIRTKDGEVFQTVEEYSFFSVSLIDFTGSDGQSREEEWIKKETGTPISIADSKLHRFYMLRYNSGEEGFLMNVHHIACDGWTIGLLGDQIKETYNHLSQGNDVICPEKPSYLAVLESEKAYLESKRFHSNRIFWQEYFSDLPDPLKFPISSENPGVEKAERFVRYLPAEYTQGLQKFCQDRNVSLFILFFTALSIYLYRVTRQEEFVIGTATHNRTGTVEKQIAGMFVNILPCRQKISGFITFESLLEQIKLGFISLFRNQKYPFDLLMGDVRKKHDYQQELFKVVFSYENKPILLNNYWNFNGVEAFPLVIHLVEREGSEHPKWEIDYKTSLFSSQEIESLYQSLLFLVEDGIACPEKDINDLKLLHLDETNRQLQLFNRTSRDYITPQSVRDVFNLRVQKQPGRTAIEFRDSRVSYKELNSRANRLSRILIEKGIRPGDVVGIMLNRSPELIEGILAIVKAGATYLPIDPAYPESRMQYMLEESGSKLLLIQDNLSEKMTSFEGEILSIDTMDPSNWVDSDLSLDIDADAPLYIIFTSGSTGKPKGVAVEHNGIINLMNWYKETYQVDSGIRISQVASIGFDAMALELWPCLLNGATLCIVEDDVRVSPKDLQNWIIRNEIQITFQSTAICDQLLTLDWPEQNSLQYLLTGGDFLKYIPQKTYPFTLSNLYGPTEGTICSTFLEIRDPAEYNATPNIGTPIANTQIYILDPHHNLLPLGIPGELCIGGAGVARGYLNRPELTAKKFVPHPFKPGERIYKTGDLARWLPDGKIEFLGRLDHQVKIRGYRIELGEIESALAAHPRIREAVVNPVEEKTGKALCAYFTSEQKVEPAELREHLVQDLPDYMIPSHFLPLDSLPLTPNGKVDRKALPKPQGQTSPDESYAAPVTALEKILVQVWEEVLDQRPIGIRDNFFYRGGDSIKAIQTAAELQKRGYSLEIPRLYESPTIEKLQHAVSNRGKSASQELVTGPAPLTPIQHWFFEQEITPARHWNQWVTIPAPEGAGPEVLQQALRALVLHHDALRTVFPAPRQAVIRADEEPLFHFAQLPQETHQSLHDRLDLQKGPLLAAALDTTAAPARLSLVIHHLVVDGISWRILLEDLRTACSQLRKGETVQLPRKTDSFRRWAEALGSFRSHHTLPEEIPFWKKQTGMPLPPLRADRPSGPCTKAEMALVEIRLDPQETEELLNRTHHAYNTEMNDLLLCALALSFREWNGAPGLRLNLEGHGREDLGDGTDITRTVGWFTTSYPVVLDPQKEGDLSQAIRATKESLRRIPRKGIGYGILRYLSGDQEKAEGIGTGTPEVSFNYLGVFNEQTNLGLSMAPECPFPYAIDINGLVEEGSLRLLFGYNSLRYDPSTIRELTALYRKNLLDIIRHCSGRKETEKTASDYGDPSLTEEELPLLPRGALRVYPLTPLQEGMLLAAIREPETGAYFEQLSFTVNRELDLSLFEEKWQAFIDRHDILRTLFLYEGIRQPKQIVLDRIRKPLILHDISARKDPEKDEWVEELKQQDRKKPFQLSTDPPYRLTVVKEKEDRFRILFSFHHILMDGWCLGIFLRELFLDPQPKQGDYYRFLQWRQQQNQEAAAWYWQDRLEGYESPADLPGRRRTCSPFDQREAVFTLGKEDTATLTAWARHKGVTLAAVFQAAWGLLLQRYNGTDDVVFGFVVSGRPPEVPDADKMLGLFINTLPVRVESRDGDTFSGLAAQAQKNHSTSEAHSFHPLAEIQAQAGFKDGLISHIAAFENYPLPEELRTLLSDVEVFEQADYDFNLLVVPTETLEIRIRYNAAAFTETRIDETGRQILNLLKRVPSQGEVPLAELDILSEPEREKLLCLSRAPLSAYPDKTIHQVFRERVLESPERTALVFRGEKMSYREVDRRSDALAAYLIRQGALPRSVVGILTDRSFEMVIAILAVLKARCAYLPLDPSMPEERQQFILEDSGARDLIIREQEDGPESFAGRTHCLESFSYENDRQPPSPEASDPADLAYVIYTSGSTGKPKGVLVEHRNAVNTLYALEESYPLGEKDAFLLKTPYSFDVSVAELFGWFFGRGRLIIMEQGEEKEPEKILQALRVYGVTHINFVPSMLDLFLEEIKERDIPALETLRYLFSAGEAITTGIIRRFFSLTGKVRLENLYGPTEGAIYATGCSVQQEDVRQITIGQPLTNTSAYILDRQDRLCPSGVPGELCLAGPGIARGYLNRPELTQEKFLENPLVPGERMYRTGDLARWTSEGRVEYLGRMDNQVKIRGNRVELGEIETCLQGHPDILKALVIARDDAHGMKYLAAYFLSEKDPAVSDLRQHIAGNLPSYMVPAYFMKLDTFPLSPNGKLNRKKLPEPADIIQTEEEYVAPRNELEEEIDEIWQEVLGIERIGVHDNFFDLGGDSIKAIQVYSRLSENYDISMNDIFEYETIASLSLHIHNQTERFRKLIEKAKLRPIETERNIDLSFLMESINRYVHKNGSYQVMDLTSRIPYNHILLTGATGYLGIHLLKDLLEETDAVIHPLIRAGSPEEAVERLQKKLRFYFDEKLYKKYSGRIRPVTGDLGRDRLGLSEKDYSTLAEEIDCIINSAANVRHYGHQEEFEQINVKGVQRLIRLAGEGRKKDLNHVSTMSVGLAGIKKTECFVFNEYEAKLDTGFDNVYVRSKLLGEELVLQAREQGIRANIFRAGNLVFHSETGRFQENIKENAFYSAVKSYIKVGSCPKIEHNSLDFSYIDYASRAITLLFDRKELKNEIHHIINPHMISINKLGKMIRDVGYTLEIQPFEEFLDFMYANHANKAMKEFIRNILLHSHIIGNPQMMGLIQLNLKTTQILQRMDFNWPAPDKELVGRMLDYCAGVGFI